MIVCVLQLYACVVLVIHLCNHVITSDYISIPCGLVIALYCTRYIFEYCLVTVVPCRVQGPSFITESFSYYLFLVGLEQVSTLQPMRHMGRW